MADSDDTTTLPAVTRRRLLSTTMAATAAVPLQAAEAAADALAGNSSFDPALALWHDWTTAYRKTVALSREQQRLEFALVDRIGFPCARVRAPDDGERVTVYSLQQLDEILGGDPPAASIRAGAEAELARHRARWDSADRGIGYSAARKAEREAAEREQDLFDAFAGTPAISLAGIAGKLDAVLREGESWEASTNFPWPHIRSALVDLVRLAQAMEPGVFIPGGDRNGPYPRKYRDGCCFRVEPITAGIGS